MEANYVHKDSTTLVQDELVKNELNQIELQYNALKQQKFNELLKENQELKKQVEKRTKMYQNAYDYGQKMEGKAIILETQQKELKKQLENYKKLGFKHLQDKNNNLENQQKEFIKYLEDEISKQKNDIFANALTSEDIDLYIMKIKLQELEEVLQKYKEIIGDINDKK